MSKQCHRAKEQNDTWWGVWRAQLRRRPRESASSPARRFGVLKLETFPVCFRAVTPSRKGHTNSCQSPCQVQAPDSASLNGPGQCVLVRPLASASPAADGTAMDGAALLCGGVYGWRAALIRTPWEGLVLGLPGQRGANDFPNNGPLGGHRALQPSLINESTRY